MKYVHEDHKLNIIISLFIMIAMLSITTLGCNLGERLTFPGPQTQDSLNSHNMDRNEIGPGTSNLHRLSPQFTPTVDKRLFLPAIEQSTTTGETPNLETDGTFSLDVIPRAEWGAVSTNYQAYNEFGIFDPDTNPGGVLTYPQPLDKWLHTIIIHHTALPISEGPLEIQSLHMHQRGYADVGYHFIIGPDGNLYQGRPLNVRGAHVGGFNTGSIGVVLLGNMNEIHPTDKQLAALELLIGHLHQTYKSITHLAGHRDFHTGETECPGKHLYQLIPALAAAHELDYGIGGYIDPPWINPR
jgi:hypothetical protein